MPDVMIIMAIIAKAIPKKFTPLNFSLKSINPTNAEMAIYPELYIGKKMLSA